MDNQPKQGKKSAFFSAITPYSQADPTMNVPGINILTLPRCKTSCRVECHTITS